MSALINSSKTPHNNAKQMPPLEELKEFFDYKDGWLYWKKKSGRTTRLNTKAGRIVIYSHRLKLTQDVIISFKRKKWKAHRLIYAWHGYTLRSDEVIDHIDENPLNNCIENLRACTNKQNLENKKSCYSTNKTSGHLGVRWHKGTNKWVAYIHHNGQGYHLGVFVNIEDAIAARVAAEKKYYTHAPDRE
jgi:hypothetical protein